ncbi:MAG: roadblock/LC7 domain-containing protein [Promethearchaeati archaeon SRVP18_Atabeyarchaeia-1]
MGEEATLLDFRKIQEILYSLSRDCPGISGSAVLTKDGLPVASVVLPEGVDEAMLAAISASILTTGRLAANELRHQGGVQRVIVETKDGTIVVAGIPEAEAVLTVTASRDTKLGMVFLTMDKASRKLKEELTRFLSSTSRI